MSPIVDGSNNVATRGGESFRLAVVAGVALLGAYYLFTTLSTQLRISNQKAKEEAEKKAKEEAVKKAEAEQKAKERAEKKAKEEAEKKAKEEAEQKAKERAEQKAKEEAEQKAKERAEQKAKERAEKKAKEEAEKKAAEEEKRKGSLFEFDETTNGQHVAVAGNNLLTKTTGGWVTVRTKLPLSSSCRRFAFRIVHKGSIGGLSLGLLPSTADTSLFGKKFIQLLGGWSLNCDGNCSPRNWEADNKMPFTTGDVVKFEVDVGSKTVRIINGGKTALCHITGGAFEDYGELFPAVSFFEANAKVELLAEYPEN